MNERIKDLAEQCRTTINYGMGKYETFNDQRFAELIVRDCMTMCAELQADYLKHRLGTDNFQDKNIYAEGETACDILKYKMKNHFGVNE